MSTASGFATGGMVDGAPGTHLPLGPIHLGSLGDDRGLFPDLARHHADIVGPHALPLRPPHTLPLNPSGLPPSVGHDRLRMVPAEPSPSVDGIPMVDGPPNPHSQNSTTTPTNNSNPQNNENNHANNNGNNNSGGGNSSDPTLLIPAAVG